MLGNQNANLIVFIPQNALFALKMKSISFGLQIETRLRCPDHQIFNVPNVASIKNIFFGVFFKLFLTTPFSALYPLVNFAEGDGRLPCS